MTSNVLDKNAARPNEFRSCSDVTVGAEWELQLLDSASLDLTPGIEPLLHAFEDDTNITPEFVQSCVEIKTPVCRNAEEASRQLRSTARQVLHQCERLGMVVAGGGTHPFCRRLALITPLPRYESLADRHGFLALNQLAFATHVHIGMPSGDDAIRVMRLMTPLLPILIALSANSPFWRGYETGFVSYRRRLLAAYRSYGIPPYFEDWTSFAKFLVMAKTAGSIETIKDVHWDIRPHPDFGTLEFRVMDSQSTVDQVEYLVGLIRTVGAWVLASSDENVAAAIPKRMSSWIERENHFRASHWGADAELIADGKGGTVPVLDLIDGLLTAVEGTAREIGESAMLEKLHAVAINDLGHRKQSDAFAQRREIRDVAAYQRDLLSKTL